MTARAIGMDPVLVRDGELLAGLKRDRGVSRLGIRPVRSIERRPSPYRSSFRLDEITVSLDGGARVSLVLKDLRMSALSDAARAAKPSFLLDPEREPAVYREILAQRELGTAQLYAHAANATVDRYWLLLERVDGVELYQIGDFEVWKGVARWLARLHASFATEPRLAELADRAHLLRYDERFYRVWAERAFDSLVRSSALDEGGRDRLATLRASYGRLIEALVELPVTFIHGEFYASNVLVGPETPGRRRVCPIDWEMAALGPGPMDLAALVAGRWTEAQKAALADAYYAEPAIGPRPPTDRTALMQCRLHIAIQWLGWARSWNPPAEHVQDWLQEAFLNASLLGLT